MKEEWRPAIGFEGFYEVSDLGRVRSIKRNGTNGVVLRKCFDQDGYVVHVLAVLGKHKTMKAHRLVAQAFIPNPNEKPCVNHIDNVRDNNLVSNLEWCTFAENNSHMLRQGRQARGEMFLTRKRDTKGRFA